MHVERRILFSNVNSIILRIIFDDFRLFFCRISYIKKWGETIMGFFKTQKEVKEKTEKVFETLQKYKGLIEKCEDNNLMGAMAGLMTYAKTKEEVERCIKVLEEYEDYID